MAQDTLPQEEAVSQASVPMPQDEAVNVAPTPTTEGEKKNCSYCGQDLKFKARPKTDKAGFKNIDDDVPDTEKQLINLPPLPSKRHPDFIHCMPPEDPIYRKYSIFTAGSIEMGAAVQWQKLMAEHLSDLPITVLNPRRGHWDPLNIPKSTNPNFKGQVDWELDALENATVICFFFDVTTRSPVSLLELGLWASSKKVIVCCNGEYWKSANVDLVCARYGIPYATSFSSLLEMSREMLLARMELDENGDVIGPNEPPKDKKKSTPMDVNYHPKLPQK